jgi:hypothetical protein
MARHTRRIDMKGYRIARVVRFLVLAVVLAAVASAVVMGLWNWLMPTIFGWRAITFWQALGLLVLCRILFGRLGGPGRRTRWRHRMTERLQQMTPEERERFLAGMKGRGGPEASPSSGPVV